MRMQSSTILKMPSKNNVNWNIIHLEETDSTNRYLRERSDGDEFTVVVADFQTAGRGQGVNTWESERGKNLLFSILVRPTTVPAANQFVLSMGGALALKRALDAYTDDISLKWPNDIYWRNRKISGTLIETSVSDKCLKTCVFGIGININQDVFLSDAPNPVSLRQILGREVALEEVFKKVLDAFEKEYQTIMTGDYDNIFKRYSEALYRRTGFHRYSDCRGMFEAETAGVKTTGELLLRDRSGHLREYAFKEVTFIIN